MCRFIFLGLMLIFSTPSFSRNHTYKEVISLNLADKPNPIKKIAKRMARADVFILSPPESKDQKMQNLLEDERLLTALATSQELENLLRKDKSAVVRLYAFKALTIQLHDIPIEIMHIVKADEATARVIDGEKTETMPVKQVIPNFLF